MLASFIFALLFCPLVCLTTQCPSCSQNQALLTPLLSLRASIVCNNSAVPRWSEYREPNPGTIVNVATEKDVAIVVQYSNEHDCSFLAQNGGSGWTSTFHISQRDILINLRGINHVSFNAGKTQATVQGGAIVSEVVDAANANNARLSTATCNCVGYLGAVLGGGLSRTMGLYGLGIDQLLSVNLVTSSGNVIHVDSNNPDLWWALRGAAANFGIVTSARVKAYPIPAANNTAWTGVLVFTQDKIEALVRAINDLDLKPEMEIDLYYATTGPPNYTPIVITLPFYVGTAAAGRAAFASVLAIGPATDGTRIVPYSQWNAGGTSFCIPGSRKPAYGVSMNRMDPTTWRSIWNKYVSFLAENPGTGNSIVLAECYSTYKARSIPSNSSSYPFRSIQYHAVAIPWYSDTSLDATANAFASSIRDMWRSTDNLDSNSSYINFAHGDESLHTIYGESVGRLQTLKKRFDPHKRFNQWYPLS